MNKVNRRAFVRRGGAATLGTVLGLGLLPSLTRKLHATDQSELAPNAIKFNFDGSGNKTQSWDYMGGTLTLAVTLSCSPEKDVCTGVGVMSILRTAAFSILYPPTGVKRVLYKGNTAKLANVVWQCVDGKPSVTSVTHPSPPTTPYDVAIANPDNPRETIGTLFTVNTASTDTIAAITAVVLIGDELSPQRRLELTYSVTTCTI